jgi:signal transduction histidine kinase
MSFLTFSSIFAFLANFYLGILVLEKRERKVLNLTFSLTMFSMCLGTMGDIIIENAPTFALTVPNLRLLYSLAMFGPALFMHFSFLFALSKPNRYVLFACYGVSSFLAFVSLISDQFISGVGVVAGKATLLTGPFFNIFSAYSIIVIAFAFVYSLYRAKVGTAAVRQNLKYQLYAILFEIVSAIIYFSAVLWGIEVRLDNLFVVLYAGTIAFGILKQEQFEIKLTATRFFAGVATLASIGFGYVSLILLDREYIHSFAVSLGIQSIYVLICARWYEVIRNLVQTTTYKKFLKINYNFESTLKTASSQLVYAQNRDSVLASIYTIQESMEIGESYAILRHDTEAIFDCIKLNKSESDFLLDTGPVQLPFSFNESSPLIRDLTKADIRVVQYSDISKAAKDGLSLLKLHRKSLLIAIHSFKELQAVFIIGQRLNEEAYSEKDMALFEVVANQAIIVFERITQTKRLMAQRTVLEKLNIELESKVKEAVALAQKHFHQAAFATLTSGMAHEIRNPMAAILGTAQFLAEAMDARYEGPSKPLVGEAAMVWNRPITSEDFVGLLNGNREKADSIFGALVDHGFISPEGALTDRVDIVSGELSNLDLGPSFVGDEVFIESMMKRLAQTTLLIEFINVVSHHIPRLLEITETMMRYGISGGGIKDDTFTKINGITFVDSCLIFETLRTLDYLDERGGVLPKFHLNDPAIDSVLAGHFPAHLQPLSGDIVKLVKSTPGAVKQALSILDVLQNTLTLIEGSCHKKHITVRREFDRDLPLIAGDAHRLQQAFFNIVFNAVQAMDGQDRDRRLTVRVARAQFPGVGGRLTDGIELQFEDTGPGISPDTKANIFNPFFTTKDPTGGKNIGLGLSILYEVISGHGGYIDVESELDQGTVFKVVLPRWEGRV